MSFYDSENTWAAPARTPSWEQQQGSTSRSGATSSMSHHSDSGAFAAQFEEIERATDNLMKSGKWAPGNGHGQASGFSMANVPNRRDSGNVGGRGFDYSNDPRMGGGPSRHHSVSDFEGGRPNSAGLQNFYAGQRFPGGRQSEAEQVLQAKRRMAAQRERELRNYHQEQQYNRSESSTSVRQSAGSNGRTASVSGAKPDRAMSPNTMNDEDRRELIARQHRALYGDSASMYSPDGSGQRTQSQVSSAGRGQSPLAFDPYQAQAGAENAVQMPPRDRAEAASPASNPTTQQSFALLSDAQQSNRTSNSSPGASPPLAQGPKGTTGGVAPIGTRPVVPVQNNLNKRATTPLTPSGLGFGFSSAEGQSATTGTAKDERSTSTSSNNAPLSAADKNMPGLGAWGNNSGVWGSGKNTLAVQPSVWG